MPFLHKKTGETKKLDFWRALPWVWLVLAYVITMGYLVLHGRNYIDSDMSSEMVLANLLNKEGGILSKNWGYSSEIRVFYVQVFYRLALLVFPHDWYMARMLGQAAWMLVLILCMLYVGHSLKMQQNGVWAAAAMACPFGFWYVWYGAYGGYYVPYMVLLLLSFALTVQLVEMQNVKKPIWAAKLAILVLISFVNGLGSIKGLMGIYLPMAVAAVLHLIVRLHREPERLPLHSLRFLVSAVCAMAAAGVGYVINTTVLAANYSFDTNNAREWGQLSLGALVQSWCDFLSLLGFPRTGLEYLDPEMEIFSLYGVLSALSLVLAAAVVAAVVVLLQQWDSLTETQWLVPLTFMGICLVQGGVFSQTVGRYNANPSYWLTPLPMIMIVLQLAWEKAPFRFRFSRKCCAAAFMICVICVSISSVHGFFSKHPRSVPELKQAEEWLVENGYTNGYASAWNSNVLTEWSSGQLDVRAVNPFTLDVTSVNTWLERLDHSTPPEGKVFLLLSAEELWGSHKESLRNENNVYWDENDYLIMAYDSYEDLISAVQAAHEG